ncbi:DUF6468 domain-containing protein [Magnetospirillum molischianum]|uniref:DUF6468 domain-containing protein n=1 Tax=Magnetospirillum molischianum DSM 120 TaxID=1150626 RepID=H8FPS6_MAGML|nr:DUF6468 domain-containing protein [Magnetospirillum molischianum]CCG40364.1 conserved hypothetical protein [Magnetospirillum molischianum DSM 120]
MDWKVLLDIVVSVLMVATIAYATRLNSRLAALRKNRDDLARTIVGFNEATLRAESSIPKLRKAADEAGQSLQERVEKAQSLRDDLAFMIERADTMANRLENAVRSARVEGPARSGAETAAASRAPASGPAPSPGPAPSLASGRPSPSRSAQQAAVASASAAAEYGLDDERSEAERELLRALQAMR